MRDSSRNGWIVLGVLYVCLALLAYFNAWDHGTYDEFFWFCYLSLFLLGIGLIFDRPTLVVSQLFIITIPDIIWSIDFISYLVKGSSFFGITDYYFTLDLLQQIVSLSHILSVPVAFIAFYRYRHGIERSWIASFIQVIALYVLSRVFTSSESNINCVYRFCGSLAISDPYAFWWFVSMILIITCTPLLLLLGTYLIDLQSKRYRR